MPGEVGRLSEPVVITGAGVITSIGAGFEEFSSALFDCRVGMTSSEVIDFGDDLQAITCEVEDFSPQRWLGPKGIRVLDRSARLLAVAAQLCLDSVERVPPDSNEGDPDLGLVCGTIFGSIHSIASFDWSGLEDGVKYVNPMAFPNTVINSPAGQAAIRHKLGGVNSTISAGLASGLIAIQYATDFLRLGRARMLLAGGVEEIAEESYLGFRKNGLLSSSQHPRPFLEERDGVILGEGSALLALELKQTAVGRGATPLAEVAGVGSSQDARRIDGFSLNADGAERAIREALRTADIGPQQVGGIISSASGSHGGDFMELEALRRVFGDNLAGIPISCPKASCGETLGAAGAIGAAAALAAVQRREIPPTAGTEDHPQDLSLRSTPQPLTGDNVLVTAFSCEGSNAAVVLR
jgi:3-oxoacyl-[acyl-carrier-protein] synthase II